MRQPDCFPFAIVATRVSRAAQSIVVLSAVRNSDPRAYRGQSRPKVDEAHVLGFAGQAGSDGRGTDSKLA